ncbi:exodeoxyribonuclease VII large subunit [Acaryochloris marina]|uniref:Exodeoxyribonuclease 7 large subunit n=1 Tax=Acaryochloris marina (strain MBIC 11017) TaxID=329726 RepID=EX7L_ACAM1|nr:exodeoxyribonuclease VII large subunit [Acaryochloris marina]B0BZ38.1 RecName: Full=Exodeoxyribonuclease 7 large subunit; AltName: Full=Exodeoxyribonuclease VII large subunit; Short=Exonuclease VII large subunit [Acaryochloris marina MBIC11017]ABW28338.1 exodeoxyribonuclease VII, large subunit [Acaryochloris marina MBIC11017]
MTSYQPNLLVPPEVLSVKGLTDYIQTLLEDDSYLVQVWVEGEVSSAARHRSGFFFTLQDQQEAASIHCVIWNSYCDQLVIEPEVGEQILALGRIRVYPQRGQYQLMAWQLFPAGEGLRSLRYQQLRERLTREGLFDPLQKQALPTYPQTVGVVTSHQAAAWGDIKRTLKAQHPGLKVLFSPTKVQGKQAPEAIVLAIERVIKDGRAEVLIVARGGGATEDLACFNDERVVRAIAECPIPVISGIGHQRDETLADLVADVCAHTPTAAAECIPRLTDWQTDYRNCIARLYIILTRQLDVAHEHLLYQKTRLRRLQIDRQFEREQVLRSRLQNHLLHAIKHRLGQAQQHQQLLQQQLTSLDPTQVLKRGYALVQTTDQQIVRSTQQLQVDQELKVELAEGHFTARVTALQSSPQEADDER